MIEFPDETVIMKVVVLHERDQSLKTRSGHEESEWVRCGSHGDRQSSHECAEQAEGYGFVNRAVAKGTVVDDAMKLAATIAAKSRIAIQAALIAVNEGMAMDLRTAMRYEREQFGICYASEDKKEGVAAFTGKREPSFKDR